MKIAAGDLDRRITLYQIKEQVDATIGIATNVVTAQHTLPAMLVPRSGDEGISDERKSYDERIELVIRYRPALHDTGHIVSYNSTIYGIEHIEEIGRRQFLLLSCSRHEDEEIINNLT